MIEDTACLASTWAQLTFYFLAMWFGAAATLGAAISVISWRTKRQ